MSSWHHPPVFVSFTLFSLLFPGMDCHHEDLYVKTLGRRVSARFCSIFPVVNVGGAVKHLQLTAAEMNAYDAELVALLKRYVKRMAWLMSKSHRIFGVVAQKKVVLLIDTSGWDRGLGDGSGV